MVESNTAGVVVVGVQSGQGHDVVGVAAAVAERFSARLVCVVVDPALIRERYLDRNPVPVDDLAWCRALASFRFAAMTLYNLRLHRTGRRIDATWEQFGQSLPELLGSARRFLAKK